MLWSISKFAALALYDNWHPGVWPARWYKPDNDLVNDDDDGFKIGDRFQLKIKSELVEQKCQTIFPQADLAITRAEKEARIVAE